MKNDGTVDEFLAERASWREEMAALRAIVLAAGLNETLKWGQPCYTDGDHNILLISSRKASAVISFLRGALLDDPLKRLIQPGENSRSARYLSFTSVAQVAAEKAYVEKLVTRAVEVARAGLRVERLSDEIDYIDELQRRLDADEAFRVAFEGLTPGRRRGYNLHFGQPKQSSTREDRITRCTERILLGKGFRDCICGFSKRLPSCDGSHKNHHEDTWVVPR